MARKTSFATKKTKTIKTKTLAEQLAEKIEEILRLYATDKAKARLKIEEQARRVWLQYLFQQHQEVTVIVDVEEVEERQLIVGGGNPNSEIITTRKTKRTSTKTVTPRVPLATVKAALTFDWSMARKYEELNALALCVEAGLLPESAKDAVVEYTTGVSNTVLELPDNAPDTETNELPI